MRRAVEEMSTQNALDRAFDLIDEFLTAGREDDALAVARLINEIEKHVKLEISDEELDRRLAEADEDIAAGRVTPDEEVWARIEARWRRATGEATVGTA